jgi:hypothetical protein
MFIIVPSFPFSALTPFGGWSPDHIPPLGGDPTDPATINDFNDLQTRSRRSLTDLADPDTILALNPCKSSWSFGRMVSETTLPTLILNYAMNHVAGLAVSANPITPYFGSYFVVKDGN